MKLPQSKVTGLLGMKFVECVALKAGCKPIPVPEELDTGVDGYLEFGDEAGVSRLVAFQVKCGKSFFDAHGPRLQPDSKHIRYWASYPLPVILVIVNEAQTEAFWMDVREQLRGQTNADRPIVLRPPKKQIFESGSLTNQIQQLAALAPFGDAVAALTDSSVEGRITGLYQFYRFRFERRTPFCIAAALKFETNALAIAQFCNFYSRYFSHPEWQFGADTDLEDYARSLLKTFGQRELLSILTEVSPRIGVQFAVK